MSTVLQEDRTARVDDIGTVDQLTETSAGGIFALMSLNESRRRLWHMVPGLLPFVLWAIPHEDPISPTLLAIVTLLIVGLGIAIFVFHHRIERTGRDEDFKSAVLGYTGSVLTMLYLFPAHAELGLTVLGIIAFGDGSATLGGLTLRGPKLPWNRAKRWSGSLCFLVFGGLLGSLIYWGEAQPGVSFSVAATCVVTATCLAAIAESIPSRINDNVRVGVVSAITLAVMHGLMVGWA